MHFPQFYYDHQEIIDYGFFGVLTTILNYIIYFLCLVTFGMHYASSNAIAWFIAVIFAFITNKYYVFHSVQWDFSTTFRECWQFISARIISVLVETALLWLFIDIFLCDERIIKIFTNIVVIILNYLFSKLIIFKNKKNTNHNIIKG